MQDERQRGGRDEVGVEESNPRGLLFSELFHVDVFAHLQFSAILLLETCVAAPSGSSSSVKGGGLKLKLLITLGKGGDVSFSEISETNN